MATSTPSSGTRRPLHLAEPFNPAWRVIAGSKVEFVPVPRVRPGNILVEGYSKSRFGGWNYQPVFEDQWSFEEFGVKAGPVAYRFEDKEIRSACSKVNIRRGNHGAAVAVRGQHRLMTFCDRSDLLPLK